MPNYLSQYMRGLLQYKLGLSPTATTKVVFIRYFFLGVGGGGGGGGGTGMASYKYVLLSEEINRARNVLLHISIFELEYK